MSISSDGILTFGVDLGDDYVESLPWFSGDDGEEEEDFDDWLCKLQDVSSDGLWDEYYTWEKSEDAANVVGHDKVGFYEKAHPEWREKLSAYYARKREVVAACPIEVVHHCSYDYTMLIIAVRGTTLRASRGSPEVINGWVIEESRVAAAHSFCAEHGIPSEDPRWLLASIYG